MKLKLGPIPDASLTRVMISISAPLKQQLDRYADAYSQSFGVAADVRTLIPLMLQTFLDKDRAFQKIERGTERSRKE